MSGEALESVQLSCAIGFDERRYLRFSEGLGLGPEAFTVVTGIEIGESAFELPYRGLMIDLKKQRKFDVDPEFASRLDDLVSVSLLEFGTAAMDCEAFARMMVPPNGENAYRPLGNREKPKTGAVLRMASENPDVHGDHWVVGLGQKKKVLHVAGQSGRLMVSSLKDVAKMYPSRALFELH